VKPSKKDIVDFVRDTTGTWCDITPESQLEADLRITGDDGIDLLEAAEQRFGVNLSDSEHGIVATLNLGPNECFFSPEGSGLVDFVSLFRWLRGKPQTKVRDLTVAELHEAILRAPPLTASNAV